MSFIKPSEQQIYNSLLSTILALPVGCPVMITKPWCAIIGIHITGNQARRFGKEISQTKVAGLQHVVTGSNNLRNYKRI